MSDVLSPLPDPGNAPIDVANGELLLAEVYLALRSSSYWDKTLFIVTYDEPGGTYDHVAPVPMTPPGPSVVPASNGFPFNWSGGRMPAIIVSPFAPPGSQLVAPPRQVFDHTSIIKTTREDFPTNMGGPINDRDASAPSLLPRCHGRESSRCGRGAGARKAKGVIERASGLRPAVGGGGSWSGRGAPGSKLRHSGT